MTSSKKSQNWFLIFISAIFLFLFEMAEMFPQEEGVQVNGFSSLVTPLVLFAAFFIPYIENAPSRMREQKYLLLFSWVIVGIYLISLLNGGVTASFQTKSQYITVILPLFALWGTRSTNSTSTDKWLLAMGIIFVGLSIYFFITSPYHIVEEMTSRNNGAYTLLYLLPFILCFKKSSLRIGGLIITFIALLFSMKRGGLVAFAIAVLVYGLVNIFFVNKKKIGIGSFILSVIVIAGLIYMFVFFDELTGNILSVRFQSLEDDGGSGRMDIYSVVWSHIKQSSFFELLFGHGWDAVRQNCGMEASAHNDFLEVLYDFGIVVFLLYVAFFIEYFKVALRMIKKRSFYAAPVCSSFAMVFFNSMVSHIVVYPKYAIILSLFLGLMSNRIKQEI